MKNILFLAAGIMLVCIIILASLVLITSKNPLSSLSFNNLHQPPTQNIKNRETPPRPTENCSQYPLAAGCEVVGVPINICLKKYPNYPSPSNILTTKADPNLGVYDGIISNLNLGLQSITVTSLQSGKTFVFNGGSVNGKIYDIHHSVVNAFYTVKTGAQAVVSFPCSQKTGFFILNQFQIVQ